MSQIQYTFNKNDEYYTPAYAVYPLLNKLKPQSTIWCPFDTEESMFVKVFRKHNFKVVYGHISTGQDFFQTDCPDCDYIISNPPYSLKSEIFKRLYEIGKPFAMLINFQGVFDHKDRFEMFKDNRTEMLWLHPRVSYITSGEHKASGIPFQSGYLCSGICDNQLNFMSIDKTINT